MDPAEREKVLQEQAEAEAHDKASVTHHKRLAKAYGANPAIRVRRALRTARVECRFGGSLVGWRARGERRAVAA